MAKLILTNSQRKQISEQTAYWKAREEEARKHTIEAEEEFNKQLDKMYAYMTDEINTQVNAWYTRYANKEGITVAEAMKRVATIDIDAYAKKAEKYVLTKDFSERANTEMRLYNLAMKVNRLELLKAQMNLELVKGYDDIEAYMRNFLTDQALAEFRRQAGILGDAVPDDLRRANEIVNASFHSATFSDDLWKNQVILQNNLNAMMISGLIRGRNPRALASDMRKVMDVGRYEAERLMRTELCRIQTAAQQTSYIRNGYDEYQFNAETGAARTCEICQALDGKVYKVKDMLPGKNAPPRHPNCRCSTNAYMNDDEFRRWLSSRKKSK